jgi:hypothetical protein
VAGALSTYGKWGTSGWLRMQPGSRIATGAGLGNAPCSTELCSNAGCSAMLACCSVMPACSHKAACTCAVTLRVVACREIQRGAHLCPWPGSPSAAAQWPAARRATAQSPAALSAPRQTAPRPAPAALPAPAAALPHPGPRQRAAPAAVQVHSFRPCVQLCLCPAIISHSPCRVPVAARPRFDRDHRPDTRTA